MGCPSVSSPPILWTDYTSLRSVSHLFYLPLSLTLNPGIVLTNEIVCTHSRNRSRIREKGRRRWWCGERREKERNHASYRIRRFLRCVSVSEECVGSRPGLPGSNKKKDQKKERNPTFRIGSKLNSSRGGDGSTHLAHGIHSHPSVLP